MKLLCIHEKFRDGDFKFFLQGNRMGTMKILLASVELYLELFYGLNHQKIPEDFSQDSIGGTKTSSKIRTRKA